MMHFSRHQRRRGAAALRLIALALSFLYVARATGASSWSPTLLVNTEAFQVIDDQDTTANVVLKFGNTLNETLTWNRTRGAFQFSDDVFVQGTLSGSTIHADTMLNSSGSLVVKKRSGTSTGNIVVIDTRGLVYDGSNKRVGIGIAAPEQKLHIAESNENADAVARFEALTVPNAMGTPTTAGPLGGGTAANDSTVGTLSWTSANNALADDGSATYVTLPSTGDWTTRYLKITNFGFGIPAGSVINGITVAVDRQAPNDGSAWTTDNSVRLVKSGTITGTDNADTVSKWPTSFAFASYGGSSNLWGSTWTATDINASDFGVVLSANIHCASCNNDSTQVDYVRVTIDYTSTVPFQQSWTVGTRQATGNFTIAASGGLNLGRDVLTIKYGSGYVGLGTTTPKARLQVAGSGAFTSTVSGSALNFQGGSSYILGNTGIGKSGTPKAKLDVLGTMSGNALYVARAFSGAGLTDCDTASTSKLLWDATTGRFSCGTDVSGTFGSGNVLTMGDNRYVKKAGDTMTGTLVIQNGNTHSATNTPLLNIRGTMSGRSLHISGTGSVFAPMLTTQTNIGTMLMGTGSIRVTGTGTMQPQLYIAGRVPLRRIGSGGTIGSPLNIAHQGNYLYLANQTNNNLQIMDISDPTRPITRGSASADTNPFGVAVQGNYAYTVSNTNSRLQVFDISNPNAPRLISQATTGTAPRAVTVSGRYAYVINGTSSSMQIFDISNPNNPFVIGSVSTSTLPSYVHVQGRYAYVSVNTGKRLQVIDVNDPANPSVVGNIPLSGNPTHVYVQGRYAYVSQFAQSNFIVVDVSVPTSPVLVGTGSATTTSLSMTVQGRYAYVTGSNRIELFDVSNPTKPVSLGSVTSGLGTPQYSVVQGRYLYAADNGNKSVQVYDLGGAYVQQLEVGGLQAANINTRGSLDAWDGTFAGNLGVGQSLRVSGQASFGNALTVSGSLATASGNILFSRSGSVVFNEQSRPVDFRIEGDTDANLFFLDASSDRIGVGNTLPKAKFSINGVLSGTLLQIDRNAVFAGSGIILTATGGAVFNEQSRPVDFRVEGDTDANAIFVDASSDNVGIGSNLPETKLEVIGMMSGKTLYVTGTGGTNRPLISARNGRVGIGTDVMNANLTFSGSIARANNKLFTNGGDFRFTQVNLGFSGATNYKYSAVLGGFDNVAGSGWTVVAGGNGNYASGSYAFVGGGQRNVARTRGTVGGGEDNVAGPYGTVAGGQGNIVTDTLGTVGGGFSNEIQSRGGGINVIAGGNDNTIKFGATYTSILGGNINQAYGYANTIGAGEGNVANGYATTIAGGQYNVTNGTNSTVGGGELNTASGYAVTIAGGKRNVGSGTYAAIPGGLNNIGMGPYSFVGGRNMRSGKTASGSFVWGSSPTAATGSYADAFMILSSRVGIGTLSPKAALHVVGSGAFTGTVSGSTIMATDALRSSGALVFEGAASGSSLYLGTSLQGAGLSDCDTAATSKLLWDASTGRFSCGTDQTGGGSGFGSGNVLTLGDNRYVKKAGDTMTGALRVDVTGGNFNTLGLRIANTASGAHVHAEQTLTTSGSFVVEGNLTFGDAIGDSITVNAGTWTFANNTTFTMNGGAGTLEVVGTLSGSKISVNGALNVASNGAITGATIDVTKNTISNVTGSLVWYVDGTLAVGTEQSIVLTMPFAFTAKAVELRTKTGGHPSGQSLIVDINENGTTLFSTRPEVDAGSTVEDGNHVFSDTSIAKGAEMTMDIDQVGSTKAGSGITVMLKGTFDM